MHKIIILMASLLASCSSVPSIAPYKIDIQQGNVVTQEMVSKLKPGMSKAQVRFILGTPLVTDAFHPDRWDYIYVLKKGGKLLEQRKLTVLFEGDALKRLEGDVVATPPEDVKAQQEKVQAKAPETATVQGQVEQKSGNDKAPAKEKGFFGRMFEKIGL